MEMYEVVVIIISVGLFILIGMRMFLSRTTIIDKPKLKTSNGHMSVNDAFKAQVKVLTDTIDVQKKELTSVRASNSRLKGIAKNNESDEYEPEDDEDVPLPVIKMAAIRLGLNAEDLDKSPELVTWVQGQLRDPDVKKTVLNWIKNNPQPKNEFDTIPGV